MFPIDSNSLNVPAKRFYMKEIYVKILDACYSSHTYGRTILTMFVASHWPSDCIK